MQIMIDPFVAASVRRFEAVARRDCSYEEAEEELFALVDETCRDAHDKGQRLGPVVKLLESLAHEAEIPPPGSPDEEDHAAPLRYAGLLRRAADLLSGPEKDLTPGALSDQADASPRPRKKH